MDPALIEQLASFIIALLAGAVMWGMGILVIRAAVGLAGLVLGGLIGWLTWVETGGAFPLWTVMLVFAVVVACVSLLIYRLLVAGLLAVILALISFVTLWSVLSFSTPAHPDHGSTSIAPAPLVDLGLLILGSGETDVRDAAPVQPDTDAESSDFDDLLPAAVRQARRVQRELGSRLDHLRLEWAQLDATTQLIIVASVLGGLLLGLLIATFAPKITVMIVTAVLGSLLILGSAARLLGLAGAPMHELLDVWILLPPVAWATLAVAGMSVQVMLRRRRSAAQKPDES
ncbi:MAG: hypothetical protein CMJ24_05770 [Phycisphaerae bacterium]|nr:hypothetical protein [Phycisphaerae bacterium]|tara:strand:- start:1793 stop:2653 length:861 start_codon:yes stop_codon:yes gene_type:complete